jgi:NitT/TauT family transport system ATP-binding protein
VTKIDIVLDKISKSFDGKVVLDALSLVIPDGKVTCIMAPSGMGKTTLLRILMGLEKPDAGRISGLEGLKKSAVFQEDRLCEDLTPFGNIRLVNPELKSEEIKTAMSAVGLSECENQVVTELSGGMKRRVAILRALLADYEILFLDEPFKGLDAETKDSVIRDTKKRCHGRTVILVTHDVAEAEMMGAVQIIQLQSDAPSAL